MALIEIPGSPIVYPHGYASSVVTGPAVGSSSLGASVNNRVAMVVRVPKTGTLDKFEYFCASHSGTNTVRQSFQDVDLATGAPDGTADQYRSDANPSSGAWFAPGLMTSDGSDTGTKRSVTRGDLLACVVDYTAYTNGASTVRTLSMQNSSGWPYVLTYNGVSWTKVGAFPVLVLKYADGTYAYFPDPVWPINAIGTVSPATNLEAALRFEVPFACAVTGCRVWGDLDGVDNVVVLYDSDGTTVLTSGVIDPDVRQASGADRYTVVFDDEVELDAATTYYIGVSVDTSGTSTVHYMDAASAALMAAYPGGAEWYYASRATPGAGAWSETTTRRPNIDLLISKIDDGTGAGSGGGRLVGGILAW